MLSSQSLGGGGGHHKSGSGLRTQYEERRVSEFSGKHGIELTDEQLAHDAEYKAETGEDFPTIEIRGKKGEEPRWGGKKLIKVSKYHPSVACEARAGARLIIVDEDGTNYAWPESWPCSAEEDEQATEAVKFKRSMALLQFYHSYLHATNELKRMAAVFDVSVLLRKILTKKWFEDIGTRCLKATIANDAMPVPNDIQTVFERKQWLKVAAAKPKDLIPVKKRNADKDGYDTDPSLMDASEATSRYLDLMKGADFYARDEVEKALENLFDVESTYLQTLTFDSGAGVSPTEPQIVTAGQSSTVATSKATLDIKFKNKVAEAKKARESQVDNVASTMLQESKKVLRVKTPLAFASIALATQYMKNKADGEMLASQAAIEVFLTAISVNVATVGKPLLDAGVSVPDKPQAINDCLRALAVSNWTFPGAAPGAAPTKAEQDALKAYYKNSVRSSAAEALKTKIDAAIAAFPCEDGGNGTKTFADTKTSHKTPGAFYESVYAQWEVSPTKTPGLIMSILSEGGFEADTCAYSTVSDAVRGYVRGGSGKAFENGDDSKSNLFSLGSIAIYQTTKKSGQARDAWAKRAFAAVQVHGGWLGCAQLSDVFARAVLDACIDSLSQQATDWVSGMDERLKEGVNETMLVRQEVLMTLTQKMAETIKKEDIDPSLIPELIAAMKLARDASFFKIADSTLTDRDEKNADEKEADASAKEWSTDFLERLKRAAEINARNPGTIKYKERRDECDTEGAILLDKDDTQKAYCAPYELGRLRASMENPYAPKEERIRNAHIRRLLQAVKASVEGEAAKERAFVKQLSSADGAVVEEGLMEDLEKDVSRVAKRSGFQGTHAALAEDEADRQKAKRRGSRSPAGRSVR